MKIIADTNIWYLLGQDQVLFEKVAKLPICPTHVNIYELSKSENVVKREELVRSAIQRLFHFKKDVINEPPFIKITQLVNEYPYDVVAEFGPYLEFSSRFARGISIDESKRAEFFKWANNKKAIYEEVSLIVNKQAEEIRKNIDNRSEHQQIDTTQIIAGFINFCVGIATRTTCSIDGLKLKEIELLLKTLGQFFLMMELTSMKMQPNDWEDFAILGYLRPGDKYWTRDKRWIEIIRQAGCEEYLFDEHLLAKAE